MFLQASCGFQNGGMLTVNDVVDWAMKTRFTVNVDGLLRTVLSVWENPNSFDLNIHITGGGKSRKATTLEELVAEAEESDYSASELVAIQIGAFGDLHCSHPLKVLICLLRLIVVFFVMIVFVVICTI